SMEEQLRIGIARGIINCIRPTSTPGILFALVWAALIWVVIVRQFSYTYTKQGSKTQNYRRSPIYRLPEEILLSTIDSLGDDLLTLYCARRVSRRFRHLVTTSRAWRDAVIPTSRIYGSYATEAPWELP